MTKDEKLKCIDQFKNQSNAFDDITILSGDVILFRPFDDAWSIKEHIVHCLEADMANFHRYRRAIAQPDTQVLSFDQIWTAALDYQSSDIRAAIDLLKMVHGYMAMHLKSIADNDWTKYAYIHDKKGRIGLEEALTGYIEHTDLHRKLIDRNIELYKKQFNSGGIDERQV